MINICLYEDNLCHSLEPITTGRPFYDLLMGTKSVVDRTKDYFPKADITLHCRDYLEANVRLEHTHSAVNKIQSGMPCLFINGRVIMDEKLYEKITEQDDGHDLLFTHMGHVVALYLHGNNISEMRDMLAAIPSNDALIQAFRPKCITKELESILLINKPWEIITRNHEVIELDFQRTNKGGIIQGNIHSLSALYNENNITIEKDVEIEDFVLLDARRGPIYIEEGAIIEAHSHIKGPAFIGKNTQVLGANIKSSSIGKSCKVGGEISGSVFYRYSNKAHEGFIGHSYVGEWVNIGAMSTTSNLKINYKPVRMTIEREAVNTEELFLGSIIADHVKLGIGTLLNTGTMIHYGASLFGSTPHEKRIFAFTWGESGKYESHQLNKFLETVEHVMERRGIKLQDKVKEMVALIYNKRTSPTLQSISH